MILTRAQSQEPLTGVPSLFDTRTLEKNHDLIKGIRRLLSNARRF